MWFLNGLKREVSKYVALLPIDILGKALQSTKKIEVSIYKKKRKKKNCMTQTLKV